MLASAVEDLSALRYPLLASPKLDGVRAMCLPGEGLVSRNGKLIPNEHVQKLFGSASCAQFDGELIVGEPTDKDCYRSTVSGVMSEDGEPNVTFYVFDLIPGERAYDFKDRLAKAKAAGKGLAKVKVLHHITIKSEEELLRYEEVCLAKGYEGVMLRDPEGPYKNGRSTVKEGWLLKLKRFADSEAKIIDTVELCKNNNEAKRNAMGFTERSSHKANKQGVGKLGTLVVQDIKSKVQFEIGTGFTDEVRKELWEKREEIVGKLVVYKFFPTGSKERPRFPVFKGFRDARDL
jgi:DNA ligase-1